MIRCGSKLVCNLRPGRLNVKQEELDDMLKEAPGPINFTVFLTMFGEKLKGTGVCSGPEPDYRKQFKNFHFLEKIV